MIWFLKMAVYTQKIIKRTVLLHAVCFWKTALVEHEQEKQIVMNYLTETIFQIPSPISL